MMTPFQLLITSCFLAVVSSRTFNSAFSTAVVAGIDGLINVPWRSFLQKTKTAFSSDYLSSGESGDAFSYLWSHFKPFHEQRLAYPGSASLNFVFLGFENGAFLGYTTASSGEQPGQMVFCQSSDASCPEYEIDSMCRLAYDDATDRSTGKISGPVSSSRAYNTTARPWYVKSKKSRSNVWTDPYVFSGSGQLGITAALPLLDASGRFLGVAGADYELSSIEALLGANVAEDGEFLIFIVDGDDGDDEHRMIASNVPSVTYNDSTKQTFSAPASPNAVVAAVSRSIIDDHGGFDSANGAVLTVDVSAG